MELQATGENDAAWGVKLNTVISLIEDAVSGWVSVTHDDTASYSLTTSNGGTDEARNMVLHIAGTLTAARNVVCPTKEKVYIIKNGTTGGYAVTLKTSGGTGISVPNGKAMILYCDGTNVVEAVTYLATITLGAATVTSLNGATVTTTTGTLTLTNGKTFSVSSTLTLAGTDGKTLTVSNSLTLAGTDGTTMTFPPASASVGYLNVPQNSQSAAYTTVLADNGKHIFHPAADTTARTWTIDSNANVAYPVGSSITFVNETSAGTLTIAITSDTLQLAGTASTGSRTLVAGGIATALKITSTKWMISGVGLS